MGADAPDPLETKGKSKGKSQRQGPDISRLIDTAVVGAFSLVAIATGHEHWLKTHEEVLDITQPLNAWLDQLPARQLQRIEKNLAPAMLGIGAATLAIPDLIVEARIRANTRQAQRAAPGAGAPRNAPPGGASGVDTDYLAAAGAPRSPVEYADTVPRVRVGMDG